MFALYVCGLVLAQESARKALYLYHLAGGKFKLNAQIQEQNGDFSSL